MKKWIVIALLACMLCGLLAGCTEDVSAEGAYQIVLDELGDAAKYVTDYHIHEGTYEDEPCFNVFVTVNGLSFQYVVSQSGKILNIGLSEHSH